MKKTSLWKEDADASAYPPLQNDLHVDVAIIGGGMTGLTAAHLLAGAGKSVALLEAWRVGGGTTGFSTGNLYATVEERMHAICSKFDSETAHAVAASRTAAIGHIENLVHRLAIDCDFHRRPWRLISEIPQNNKILEKEFHACREAGLDAYLETSTPLPFDISRALRIENQAQFNPMRYAKALAAEIIKAGGSVFERTPVLRIKEGSPHSLYTENGTVTADKIIHATHSPKGVRFVHTLMGVHREYAIAVKLNSNNYPEGIFWVMSRPHQHSIRAYTDSRGESFLLVLGEPHKVGHKKDNESCFRNLEAYAGARFDVKSVDYRWSAQNYRSADGLPYIGALDEKTGVYIATGFATDGLTYGTLAAMIISDLILDNENPWAKLYDPRRHNPLKSAGRFIKENVHVFMDYMHDLPYRAEAKIVSDIRPDEGKTVVIKGEKFAVYRDEAGVLHQVSAVCTHMKCIVNWNAEAKSWDCPCHGSRFTVDGRVIEGPAMIDLPKPETGKPH
ncbi:FAD-dependent oxidoreductase [Candidatus Methylomicrobium oryzae]|jgi:glycine/D-amino acid oxidase-like deaminating enzyme/nitrite reductase/ring-hydroxylating ferredoxin subunit|uniref:FAD-dependent oxidoreductase n=1 Tax=Candidatus Methylomicrobium oryzae TaxID=2802053 RepID=UPI0019247A86|nr:FAD-dependent oxidoreductase [Methylomicrobium sp. RS1]MBL1266096.1 FAD-dependent oxidoreductase [Methylomicrobium sp. RS1]